ncbi:MAG: CvpA family protein [Candidatus Limnocylindrales bacterium]
MTIGTTDIFLLVIIVSTLVVGFFWGAVRSLMLFAGWIIAFFAGAYLQLELGAYLARQWDNFDDAFNQMAAFGLIYTAILVAAPVVIFITTRSSQRVTRWQVLDDLVGALFAVFVAVLGIAGVMIILATYYGSDPVVDVAGGPQWTANLMQSLLLSNIGSNIYEHLVPIIGFILGPILPASVNEVFA